VVARPLLVTACHSEYHSIKITRRGCPYGPQSCTAIVTAAAGTGTAHLPGAGAQRVNVVVNYAASEAKAKSVAEEISKLGVHAVAIQADVTDPPRGAHGGADQAEFGGVEILVNDAASTRRLPIPTRWPDATNCGITSSPPISPALSTASRQSRR